MYRRMMVSAALLGLLLMTQCQGRRLDVNATSRAAEPTGPRGGPVVVVAADEAEGVTSPPSGASLPVLWHK